MSNALEPGAGALLHSRQRARILVAAILAGPALSCDLGWPPFSSEEPPTSGGEQRCTGHLDCPEDMYCHNGVCRYGTRGPDAGTARDATGADADASPGRDGAPGDTAPGADRIGQDIGCVSPTCAELGKACGSWPDPCGGVIGCGDCAALESCDTDGQCSCLFESCGGVCCGAGDVCSAGVCCSPQCTGACCGDDGCGGTCPDSCADTGQVCNVSSCACEGTCQPRSCAALGVSCGTWANGCGGEVDCGSCGSNERCSATGFCECRYQSCSGACCSATELCYAGACCTPQCSGRDCGDDGCGGTCGGCPSGYSCSAAGLCEPDAVCDNGSCEPGETCASCPSDCCPSCQDDAHEPNDSAVQAVPAGAIPVDMPGLWICDDSEDWWSHHAATAGEGLQVEIEFSHADADLDLMLLDMNEIQIAASQSVTDNEKIVLYALEPGDYLIRVLSFDHRDASYRLRLEHPPPCPEDGHEPNDDSSQPASLGALPFARTELALCRPDIDWFSFTAQAGDSARIDLSLAEENQGLHMAIFTASPVEFIGDGRLEGLVERSWLYNLTAGTYLIQISSYGSGVPTYALSATTISACANDAREPNNTQATATAIGALPATISNLTICPPEQDWFVYTKAASADFQVTLDGSYDLQLPVLDRLGNYIAFAYAQHTVAVYHQPAGDYFLRASIYGGQPLAYAFSVAQAPPCAQDPYEPNEDMNQATVPSLPFAQTGLTICNPDRDHYKVVASAGQHLVVDVSFLPANGEIDMYVMNRTNDFFSPTYRSSGRVQLEADLGADEYFLVVYAIWDGSLAYDLSISLQ